uniref:Uncharacterized protein n=1 Tax=Streptomyces fradiae TaxID=1906 RepID=Q45R62_STRFR|nr:hypothetical protein [Streptomyces fradiae]
MCRPAPRPSLDRPTPSHQNPAPPTGPVRIRETACEGYRRALAAHQAVAPPAPDRPGAGAAERQTAAMRALSRRTFPNDPGPAPIEQARTDRRRRQADASHAAALRRARAERETRKARPEAAAPQSTPLSRTA